MKLREISNDTKRDISVLIIMISIVLLGLFLRTYYAIGPSVANNFAVSGGADTFYHERVINYIVATGHQLLWDPMLNYPVGFPDPRPPFFEWAVVSMSYLYLPFVGNMNNAIGYSLVMITAIFGALIAIPMYLLGKEAFNRKVGIISAFLIATSASNMMRSVASWGGYDDVILFFVIWVYYFFIKSLKNVNKSVWVENYFSAKSWYKGTKKFFEENKIAVVYAALSGISFGTIGAMWQGFVYVEVIMLIYIVIQVFYNRFRNVSSFHLLWITIIFLLFSFPVAFPFYLLSNTISPWFNTPLYILLFVIFIIIFLELTSRWPWLLTYSFTGIVIAIVVVLGQIFFPSIMRYIYTGEGYFVKSALYSTIAEAQAPTLGQIIMNVGVGVFFIFVAGLVLMIYDIRRNRNEYYLFFVIFSIVSVYMAFSAARFIFNASPGFVIPAAYMLDIIIEKINLKEIGNFVRSISWKNAFKKRSLWLKIGAVAVVAFLIIFPNMWGAVDAAIPYENKSVYDREIYNVMPSIFRPQNYTPPWYLGAYGIQLDTNQTDPWQGAFAWLSKQDNNQAPQYRPGFLSWWDYGFQDVELGQHPAVADNFQNGYQVAGQFITAQNESEAISLMIARILDATILNSTYGPEVRQILTQYLGAQEESNIMDYYTNLFKNPTPYINKILGNPNYYGLYSKNITPQNAKYVMIKADLANKYSENTLVNLYILLERVTGYSIDYFATDYRLFPFSGSNTGIFYAPAYLADRNAYLYGGQIIPYNFYNITAVGSNGISYPINAVPANVQIVSYNITYYPMFFNSMLYRAFVGYSGLNLGIGPYIPGLSSQMSYYPVMFAWNLTHFEVVYSISFWNPYKDYQNHSNAWKPVPLQEAYYLQKTNNGTVVLIPPANQILPQDVVILKFYPGAIIQGRVTLPDGTPLSNVLVTLYDQYGIPHTYTRTNSTGYYTLYAVAGNDTIEVTTGGGFNKLFLNEKNELASTQIYISDAQASRIVTGINPDGLPNYYITKNFVINSSSLDGVVYFANLGNSSYLKSGSIYLINSTYGLNYSAKINTNGYYSFNNLVPQSYDVYLDTNGSFVFIRNINISLNQHLSQDIPIYSNIIKGIVIYENGTPAVDALVKVNGPISYSIRTDANGSYSVNVIPGNYKIDVYVPGYYAPEKVVSFSGYNATSTNNFEILKSYVTKGFVYLNGSPASGAIVRFMDEFTFSNTQIAITGNDGSFTFNLPEDYYSVYVDYFYNNMHYVYIGNYTPYENNTIYINLNPAIKFSGNVYYGNVLMSDAGLMLFNGENFLRVYTNGSGYFSAYVPKGYYNIGVVAYNATTSQPYAYYTSIFLNNNYSTNIYLQTVKELNGTVQWNGTIIKNAVVFLKYDNSYFYESNIASDGTFHFYVTRSDYNVTGFAYGFNIKSISLKNMNITLHLQEMPCKVYGNVIYPSNYVGDIYLLFSSSSGNFKVKVNNGTYVTYLPIGYYNISALVSNVQVSVTPLHVILNTGILDLPLNINLKMSASITLIPFEKYIYWFDQDGNLVSSGNNVSLPLGKYTYYAFSENNVSIGFINLSQNTVQQITLINGYYVIINILNSSTNLNLLIDYNGLKMIKPVRNSTSLLLPPGYYSFSISEIYKNNVYYASESSYIYTNSIINLYLKTKPYMGLIMGTTNAGNNSLSFATIYLFGENNIYTAASNSNGFYSIYLPVGKYTVYSSYGSIYSFLGNLTVGNNATYWYNISYMPGYYLKALLIVSNISYNGPVNIHSIYGNITANALNGIINLLLPAGNYKLTGKSSLIEYGLNILYTLNYTLNLNNSNYYTINFNRNNIDSIEMSTITGTLNGKVGENLSYMISLKNTGNRPENVTLESLGSWNVTFSKKYVNIMPGQTSIISLNLQISNKANYGLNTITIRGIYNVSSYQQTTISVNVSAYHNTTLSWGNMFVNGNSLYINLTINNNGNVVEKYDLNILNSNELNSLGWSSNLTKNISVDPWSSYTLTLKLTANKAMPAPVFQVIVSATSNNIEYLTTKSFSLSSINTVSTNIIASNVTYAIPSYGTFFLEYTIVTLAIIAAFLGYIIWRRLRK
ncbi:MAG: glycosyltransferase family 39 protein [Thermoplasmata archaeon]